MTSGTTANFLFVRNRAKFCASDYAAHGVIISLTANEEPRQNASRSPRFINSLFNSSSVWLFAALKPTEAAVTVDLMLIKSCFQSLAFVIGQLNLWRVQVFDDALLLLIVSDSAEIRTVNLCRIKEGAAVLIGVADSFYTIFFIWNFAVAVRERHTAHADFRYLNIS